jgi:site-specific recombinase XerD
MKMLVKWYKIGKGLQAANHEMRKYGQRFDRYIRGRYQVGEKSVTIGFGWESEFMAGENARIAAGADSVPRRTFLEYCQGELARLKQNAMKGEGPITLKQDRELAEAKAKAEEKARRDAEEEARRDAERNRSFGDFFERDYWPVAQSSKKRESYRKEREHFEKWIKPVLGDMSFKDISQIQVERIKRNMQKGKRSPRSIEYVMSTFRQIWNLARESGLTATDSPSKKVKIHKPDNDRRRYLTEEEAESLLNALKEKSLQTYQISLLSLDTGCRFSEAARLTWSNVGTEKGIITYTDTKKAGGTKSRVVPMTARVKEMFEGMDAGKNGELVFPDEKGQVQGKISHTFRRVVADLKLNEEVTDPRDRVVYHSLRHTYASRLVISGVDLYPVQRLLGHSVSKMTERYSHLSNERLMDVVKQMEDAETKRRERQNKVIELKR